MKPFLISFCVIALMSSLSAQSIYKLQADSVKIFNCPDSAELILENHTQGVPGFLFNTGNGRTQFRRGMSTAGRGLYVFGADTLNLAGTAWLQGGNAFGTTGMLGTLDNNPMDFYTNGTQQGRLTGAGNWLLGTTADNGAKLQVAGPTYMKAGSVPSFAFVAAGESSGRSAVFGDSALSPADYNHKGLQVNVFPDRATIASLSNVQSAAPANLSLNEAGGKVLVGTASDNGYGATLQVNGNSYVGQQLQVGNFVPGSTVASSGASVITQGQVRATQGFNLREPAAHDNEFIGLAAGGVGVALEISSVPLFSVGFVQGASSGTQVSIASGFNPTTGSGTVNVLDFTASQIQMLSGSNSITYNFLNLSPAVNQGTYGTGISRGLYINPNLGAAADWRSIETVRGDNRLNTASGNTGIGLNSAPTSKLDVSGAQGYSQLRLRTTYTPTSSSDANGNVGDFSWDGSYFYIKTPDGWKRSALTTF